MVRGGIFTPKSMGVLFANYLKAPTLRNLVLDLFKKARLVHFLPVL